MKDIDIAKYIIFTMHKKGSPISNLQLQKILYFAHAESNATLLKEKFEAWKNGPVLRNIYNEFRHYSAEKIVDITTLEVLPNKEEKEILDNVIKAFMKLGAWNIVLLTQFIKINFKAIHERKRYSKIYYRFGSTRKPINKPLKVTKNFIFC